MPEKPKKWHRSWMPFQTWNSQRSLFSPSIKKYGTGISSVLQLVSTRSPSRCLTLKAIPLIQTADTKWNSQDQDCATCVISAGKVPDWDVAGSAWRSVHICAANLYLWSIELQSSWRMVLPSPASQSADSCAWIWNANYTGRDTHSRTCLDRRMCLVGACEGFGRSLCAVPWKSQGYESDFQHLWWTVCHLWWDCQSMCHCNGKARTRTCSFWWYVSLQSGLSNQQFSQPRTLISARRKHFQCEISTSLHQSTKQRRSLDGSPSWDWLMVWKIPFKRFDFLLQITFHLSLLQDFGRGTYRKEADFSTDDMILEKLKTTVNVWRQPERIVYNSSFCWCYISFKQELIEA